MAFAIIRPNGLPEVVAAAPAAIVVIATGAISWQHTRTEAHRLSSVLVFLASVLVLAMLCADEGLFKAAGAVMARRAAGHPQRLLVAVFLIGAAVTTVLSLDATVVLLTPVVFATANRLGVRARPHLYACTHLANSGSLLLPVSNLTNLLAFTTAGISFLHFAGLMALPAVVALIAEYVIFRLFFRADLAAGAEPPGTPEPPELPVAPIVVLGLTLAGFALASFAGASPAWAALAGAILLGGRGIHAGTTSIRAIAGAASPAFLVFVLALDVVVRAVVDNGLSSGLGHVIPGGSSLPALLAVAVLAAAVANLINNLPAALALIPLVATTAPGAVLAVLLGVNIGPNLSYAGSLATLLWRRVLRAHDADPSIADFTKLGLVSVPIVLSLSVVALWAGLRIGG